MSDPRERLTQPRSAADIKTGVPLSSFSQLSDVATLDVSYCPWCEGTHRVRVTGREEHEHCRRKKACVFARFEVIAGVPHAYIGQPECQMRYQKATPRLYLVGTGLSVPETTETAKPRRLERVR
jgi:hypothetical protein